MHGRRIDPITLVLTMILGGFLCWVIWVLTNALIGLIWCDVDKNSSLVCVKVQAQHKDARRSAG